MAASFGALLVCGSAVAQPPVYRVDASCRDEGSQVLNFIIGGTMTMGEARRRLAEARVASINAPLDVRDGRCEQGTILYSIERLP
jgi:hypothetical protein